MGHRGHSMVSVPVLMAAAATLVALLRPVVLLVDFWLAHS
jgi:hypothetical protein